MWFNVNSERSLLRATALIHAVIRTGSGVLRTQEWERDMRGLQGKRIVIAGGTSGIGAATAERLSEEGASVVIGGRNLDAGQILAKRLNEAGGNAIAVKFDLADEDSIQALIDTAATEFGGIDGLFNVGAEISAQHLARDKNLLEMDVAVWRRTFEVNLFGYAVASRAVIPHLLAQGGGAIVNTSAGAACAPPTGRPRLPSTRWPGTSPPRGASRGSAPTPSGSA